MEKTNIKAPTLMVAITITSVIYHISFSLI